MKTCRTTLSLFVLFGLCLSACQSDDSSDRAFSAEAEAAAYMEAFEGRGELTDASQPLAPDEALLRFSTPPDITIDLLASEPLVEQPVEINFDHKGRLWVVQYKQYPYPEGLKVKDIDWHLRIQFDKMPQPPPEGARGADTISFLEDTDGDGVFDNRVDAITGLNIATSVTWGRGQIWVLNPPYLLAFPDPDGDGLPDGVPVVHLSGFGLEDTHAVANSLRWGPDGWLYGAQGSTTTATIQSNNSEDVHFKGQAIWRYHPEKEVFELFAEGGGNTFHVEFDDQGRLYSGHNGGEARGQYYKQGGYYVKNWGKHGALTNPFALGYFNHMTHTGTSPRFTHAFLRYGGDRLPARYTDALIGLNPLHSFVQVSRFEREGSSFKTIDTGKLLESEDTWFRPVDIKAGPDGGVYIADWYDSRLTHIDPRDTWHKSSGRIYRIRNANAQPSEIPDFSALDLEGLTDMLFHPNRWHRQQAQRQFGDRNDLAAVPRLESILFSEDDQSALEALWAIHLSGGFTPVLALRTLLHANPYVRMWTVRLLGDGFELTTELADALSAAADRATHPEVRSQLASSTKRWTSPGSLAVLHKLLSHTSDIDDAHIPLQIWWSIERHMALHPDAVADLFKDPVIWQQPIAQQVLLNRIMQRAVQSGDAAQHRAAIRMFELAPTDASSRPLVEGFKEGLRGLDPGTLPGPLLAAYQHAVESLGQPAYALGLQQGDEVATSKALETIQNSNASSFDRLSYIQLLGETPLPEAMPMLLEIVKSDASTAVRHAALNALHSYDAPAIGEQVLAWYPDRIRSDVTLRNAALSLLMSRASWAKGLIEAIETTRRIEETDVPDHLAQHMLYLGDEQLANDVRKIWTTLHPVNGVNNEDEVNRIASIVRSQAGDVQAGKIIYQQKCGNCHRLFEEGENLGPDLTGYERSNLEAFLPQILDPSAEIREGYVHYTIQTKTGNTWSGFLAGQQGGMIDLRTFTGEVVTLPESSIDTMTPQPVSIMPAGLLANLSDNELRNLFTYLLE